MLGVASLTSLRRCQQEKSPAGLRMDKNTQETETKPNQFRQPYILLPFCGCGESRIPWTSWKQRRPKGARTAYGFGGCPGWLLPASASPLGPSEPWAPNFVHLPGSKVSVPAPQLLTGCFAREPPTYFGKAQGVPPAVHRKLFPRVFAPSH